MTELMFAEKCNMGDEVGQKNPGDEFTTNEGCYHCKVSDDCEMACVLDDDPKCSPPGTTKADFICICSFLIDQSLRNHNTKYVCFAQNLQLSVSLKAKSTRWGRSSTARVREAGASSEKAVTISRASASAL